MRKYGESKTTRIMMATVPHVTSGLGVRKFQADGFLLTRVYKSPWWRNFLRWDLILVAPQYGSWFVSPFKRVEFWGDPKYLEDARCSPAVHLFVTSYCFGEMKRSCATSMSDCACIWYWIRIKVVWNTTQSDVVEWYKRFWGTLSSTNYESFFFVVIYNGRYAGPSGHAV